ncbi:Lrp/AsnC family transcriptional regulator [Fusibacter ferrireducens]|uniref:Lrp/AsnC family transcriptional regulator n=1 Tax=Fusibacter ferrireducens TaxID=2785058 RepID=A0ABR9ZPR5_9FIRM|nr:Lrp/AsnC family transcriptional regulator [Fusibacter ferrireducens]MBF4692462.1 Lrp/AsnC family transcriptional regulator [Fusibacter ferrireducens]
MDRIDFDILAILNQNGRATATEISRQVNLSIPAVSERLRNLEDSGVIEGYAVKINRKALGLHLMAFIFVSVDTPDHTEKFREVITTFPEVLECNHITGEYGYLLKVLLEDTEALEYFISKKLKCIAGVQNSNTTINLLTLKESINRVMYNDL